jgi:type II secretory pathway predicted ATPase ExeA
MDIAELRADLKQRQQAVVDELNQLMAQAQELEQRKQALVVEAHRLNGEGRLLDRLGGNGQEPKDDNPAKK